MLLLLSYLAVVFFVSGLAINCIQLLTLVFIWPFSRAAYRRLNGFLVTYFWTGELFLASSGGVAVASFFCSSSSPLLTDSLTPLMRDEEVIWLAEYWANIRLRVFCTPEVAAKLGKERGIALCNHVSDMDWLFGWMLAHNYDILGVCNSFNLRDPF
jgi:hypothetical protein